MKPFAEIQEFAVRPSGVIADKDDSEQVTAITVAVTHGVKRMRLCFDLTPPVPGNQSPHEVLAREFRELGNALLDLATPDGQKRIRSKPGQ